MREYQNKEQFIAKCKKRIIVRNIIMDFYLNVYLPTLLKFNGKVYNIRFIKALREKAKEIPNWGELAYVKEKSYDHIEMQIRFDGWNYTDYESMYFPCELTTEGRIDYEKTINYKQTKPLEENFNKYTKEIEDTIKNYDQYMKVVDQLQKAVDEYHKLPITFRGNFPKQNIWLW